MRIISTGLAGAMLMLLASTTLAQPCFTPDACRQLRLMQEQQRAAQAAQQQAQHDAQVAKQREIDRQRKLAEQQAQKAAQEAEQAAQRAAQEAEARAEQERLALEQQRREAAEHEQERQRLAKVQRENVFAAVQQMPEMAPYFAREKGDLIFLYATTTKHVVRGLKGDLISIIDRPLLCWGFPTTQVPSGFLDAALLTATKMVNVARFDARQCSLSEADRVMFTTADLVIENGDQAKAIGDAIKAGQLMPLVEATRADYDTKVIADRNRREEEAAREREEAAKIEQGIDDGSRAGVAILQMNDNGTFCTIDTDPVVVLKAQPSGARDISLIRQAQSTTADRAFISIKTGGCSILIGQTSALRTIREGLRRDGINPGIVLAWFSPVSLSKASAALARARADQAAADEAARVAAEKARADQAAADVAARVAAEKDRAARRAADAAEREAEDRAARNRQEQKAAACAEDVTECDPSIACKMSILTNEAKSLLEGSHNALLGEIKVLQLYEPGENPHADLGNQCIASVVTSRGEMKLVYGWKVINGHSYISAHVERL